MTGITRQGGFGVKQYLKGAAFGHKVEEKPPGNEGSAPVPARGPDTRSPLRATLSRLRAGAACAVRCQGRREPPRGLNSRCPAPRFPLPDGAAAGSFPPLGGDARRAPTRAGPGRAVPAGRCRCPGRAPGWARRSPAGSGAGPMGARRAGGCPWLSARGCWWWPAPSPLSAC